MPDRIGIKLLRASDDPEVPSAEFQAELVKFSGVLRDAGVNYTQSAMAFDAADTLGYPLAEYSVRFVHEVLPIVGTALVAWLHGRAGRKVEVEFHTDGKPKRISAGSPEAVASLLDELHRHEPKQDDHTERS